MIRCESSAWRRSSKLVCVIRQNSWSTPTDAAGVLDLECLVRSDAFRTILLAFKDGPTELGPSITGLLLHLVNQPSTRQYILKRSDFEVSQDLHRAE